MEEDEEGRLTAAVATLGAEDRTVLGACFALRGQCHEEIGNDRTPSISRP